MRYFDTHTHRLTHSPSVTSITSIYNLRIAHSPDVSQPMPPAEGYFSVGIHPEDAWCADDQSIDLLCSVANDSRCIAIGEAGIDHRVADITTQKIIFALHCSIAKNLRKPLIIHCVRSQSEILQISHSSGVPRIFHSYARVNERMQLSDDVVYSLGWRNIDHSSEIDLSQILIETDDSPNSIEQIYSKFAAARKMSLEAVAEVIEKNFFRIFAL